MKANDLDMRELLHFEPNGGVITFGRDRVVIFDTVALGIIRRELIATLGVSAARGILTRFGYAHGRRTAESLRDAFPWDDDGEWRRSGGRLHTIQGQVILEALDRGVAADHPTRPFAEANWHDSYEAEQHLLHLGRADYPVCWSLIGYASGYLSYCNGREVYCVEDRCRAKGDAVCHFIGKFKERWGDAIEPHLPYYQTHSLDEALAQVTKELKRVEQRLRARQPAAREADAELGLLGMVAQSPAMKRVIDLARRVAKVDSTVLITGESGAGKERVARFIHDQSTRSGGPFVAINCGAMPEGLLESELFGHARGAFTGATQDRPGLFEAANQGTLLLDEIGEVSAPMQVKLLRVLQERQVRRVGENKDRTVNVRVLAATNRDLGLEVSAARFRQDLYYRLRVVELRVPPLRERPEDVLLLARMFLAEVVERTGRKITGFTPRVANQLVRYNWPGNVRELGNAVERAVVLATSTRVDIEDLPEEVGLALPSTYASGAVKPLSEVEREYVLAVLEAVGGNKAKAAEQLGIGQATLYRKLKEYERASSPRREG